MIKKLQAHPVVRACVLTAAFCLLLLSLWQAAGRDWWSAWHAQKTQEDAQSLYYSRADIDLFYALLPSALAEEAQTEVPEEEEALPELQPDFQALYDANPHIVGWLKAGAGIDNPVVQSDNEFYLDHDYYGREDNNGTLFLNEFNTLIPRDDVLLIHGHNMKTGTMFGDLMDYEDFEYLCQYPLVTFRTIYDPEDVFYVPLFAFNASMDPDSEGYFNIAQLNFMDDLPEEPADEAAEEIRHSAAFEEYLAQLAEVSLWQSPVEADVSDHLLMLVTCSYYHEDGRFILVCRQLRADETPEEVANLFAQD